jgi:hypothetical protein
MICRVVANSLRGVTVSADMGKTILEIGGKS